MGRVATLAWAADIEVTHIGPATLVSVKDAGAFVRACAEARIQILGLEGFRIKNGRLVPQTSLIADFSAITNVDDSLTEASRFLASPMRGDTFFEFVLALTPGADS